MSGAPLRSPVRLARSCTENPASIGRRRKSSAMCVATSVTVVSINMTSSFTVTSPVFGLVVHARLDLVLPCGIGATGLRAVPGLGLGLGDMVALAAGRQAERGGVENDRQQKSTHDGMLTLAHGRRVSPAGDGVTGETSAPV